MKTPNPMDPATTSGPEPTDNASYSARADVRAWLMGLLITTATVASAGLFQYCTPLGDSITENRFCEINHEGVCVGSCIQYVVQNRWACQNAINPWCGGTSYRLVLEYHGRCKGDRSSGCSCDYGDNPKPSREWVIPNECD